MKKHSSRIFVGIIVLLGISVSAFSAFQIHRKSIGYEWLFLVVLTLVMGSGFTVRLPRVKSKITISDIFIFASILLYGPYPATLTAGLDAYFSSKKMAKNRLKMAFNIGTMAFSTFVTGSMVHYVFDNLSDYIAWTGKISSILLPLAFVAIFQFALNSTLVAIVVGLSQGKNVFSLWKSNYMWTAMTYFSGASVAGIIFILISKIDYFAFLIALPVLFITYFTYKTYLDKVEAADHHMKKLATVYLSTVEALAMAIDAKDVFTHGHVRRVQVYALELAKAGKYFNEDALEGLKAAALLHDIGKLAIPEYVLNKPGRLAEMEFSKLTAHPSIGAQIIRSVDFPYPVHEIVKHHHEKYDGTGYPDKLKGEEIPLGSRILAIADCFEALTADRPYRPAFSFDKAVEIMKSESGKNFDPEILKVFLGIVSKVQREVKALEVPELKIKETDDQRKGAFKEKDEGLTQQLDRDRVDYSDITAAAKEVLAIYEISQTLGSTLHLSELLSVISSKIKRIVDYKTCVVYLYDRQKGLIHASHAAGQNEQLFKTRQMEPGQGITGWGIANGEKVVNDSPFLDLAGMDEEVVTSYSNAIVLPLKIQGDTLGALTLYTQGMVFDMNQVRILETVATHASKAIQNSLVFKKTQEHAVTDNLTGLYNFRYLYALFQQEKEKALSGEEKIGLLFMDLDQFKVVNDQFGHVVGDEMLQNISRLLSSQMRENDTLIRYGGDEFIALLSNITEEKSERLIDRLENAVENHQFILDSGEIIRVGISIGRSFYPDDGKTIEDLLVEADNDMYRKKEGKKIRKFVQPDNLIRYPRKDMKIRRRYGNE